jgi:inositol transport system ATP-binding protein
MDEKYIMELRNIYKFFPGVRALNDVSLKIERGKVHALMGENGAGKSTLMKIIMGIYTADKGQIFIKGKEYSHTNVIESIKAGISMIHQELNYVPYMTVADNIFLGKEPCNGFFRTISKKELLKRTKDLLNKVNLDIDPKVLMKDLNVAERQMVEIAKSISYGSDIIIMDEPTSAISDKEVDRLFDIIGELKRAGVAVIYISHKMDEIYRITDDVSVLRDGKYMGTFKINELDQDELIKLMVGRELEEVYPHRKVKIGNEMLRVENLSRNNVFTDISFSVKEGEVLGVAGLMGSGRTEVMSCIYGMDKYDGGQIYIKGKNVKISSPNDAIRNGIGLINEDRKGVGLILELSVLKNLTISNLNKLFKSQLISKKKEISTADHMITALNIKTPSRNQQVKYLSGGNQQKVVIGRTLLDQTDIIIMDEPTRGIDVGAKAEIYKLIADLAYQGKSIIMVSSEMPELIGLCDRIIVLHEGHKAGELEKSELSQERIMKLALVN